MRFVFLVPFTAISFCSRFFRCRIFFAALSLWHSHFQQSIVQAEAMQLAFLPILPAFFSRANIFPRETIRPFCIRSAT